MNLDHLDLATVDPQDMAGHIAALPDQCLEAWRLVQEQQLPAAYGDVRNVVVMGMGGSAIGGDLVRAFAASRSSVPISVVREYDCPHYVGRETLAIASSYSGNTEETLAAFGEALERGAKGLVIGTGGQLAELARRSGLPIIQFAYRSQPRAAVGYSIVCLAGALARLGLLTLSESELDEAVAVMRGWQNELLPGVPLDANAAKQVASRLFGRLPVVYGAGILAEVAHRWKTQFNENTKGWACHDAMSELNHNAVLGYVNPRDLADRIRVVMLRSKADHPRIHLRYDVTAQIMDEAGIGHDTIWARGEGPLAQMLSLVQFGDYVTYYLACLYGVDPTPIPAINRLKERLAES